MAAARKVTQVEVSYYGRLVWLRLNVQRMYSMRTSSHVTTAEGECGGAREYGVKLEAASPRAWAPWRLSETSEQLLAVLVRESGELMRQTRQQPGGALGVARQQ